MSSHPNCSKEVHVDHFAQGTFQLSLRLTGYEFHSLSEQHLLFDHFPGKKACILNI